MADEAEPRARIVEIGGRSAALGGEVSLELARPFTVLVGRNGAGKSALLHLVDDFTLRIIEIVVALELAAAGALVMIEEPETGIHPGLCDGIMAEIESAAEGLQLIISTHSPRILDRVQYHQLRHVRRNGSTRIDASLTATRSVSSFDGYAATSA